MAKRARPPPRPRDGAGPHPQPPPLAPRRVSPTALILVSVALVYAAVFAFSGLALFAAVAPGVFSTAMRAAVPHSARAAGLGCRVIATFPHNAPPELAAAAVTALAAHVDDARVASACCRALATVLGQTEEEDDGDLWAAGAFVQPYIKAAVAMAAAQTVILSAMHAHPFDAGVAVEGVIALYNVLGIEPTSALGAAKHEAAVNTAVILGAYPAIVAALRGQAHIDKDIAVTGCAIFHQSAAIAAGRAAAVAAGAPEVIVAAMRAQPSGVLVARACCKALRNLGADASGRAAVIAAGGISAATAAMQAHRYEDEVVSECAMVLHRDKE